MSVLYRLDASIRADGSDTRSLAESFQAATLGNFEDVSIIKREIGLTPLPSTAWAGAVFGPYSSLEQRLPEQTEGMAIAAELADELIAADAYVFAVPFYNFGVSQHFKAYVDIVLAEPRFAPDGSSIIAGRPAQLITAKGGRYGPGTHRYGWDHATSWYCRVLRDIWQLDLEVIEIELTLADTTPAMESLRGLAASNLSEAHVAARQNGERLARRLGHATVLDLAKAAG